MSGSAIADSWTIDLPNALQETWIDDHVVVASPWQSSTSTTEWKALTLTCTIDIHTRYTRYLITSIEGAGLSLEPQSKQECTHATVHYDWEGKQVSRGARALHPRWVSYSYNSVICKKASDSWFWHFRSSTGRMDETGKYRCRMSGKKKYRMPAENKSDMVRTRDSGCPDACLHMSDTSVVPQK